MVRGLSRKTEKQMVDELTMLVLLFFNQDHERTKLWFDTRNPSLGDVSPAEMLAAGRAEKLWKWVKLQIGDR